MSEMPTQGPVIEVKPQPNVYTVLLLISIIALAIAIGVVYWKLTSPPPVGYGMKIEEFFKPITQAAP